MNYDDIEFRDWVEKSMTQLRAEIDAIPESERVNRLMMMLIEERYRLEQARAFADEGGARDAQAFGMESINRRNYEHVWRNTRPA